MSKSNDERLLKLWKARQEAEGVDVSGVKTLEEAEHFYDKKETKEEETKKELKDMTIKELSTYANEIGIEIKPNMKKAEILEEINKAQAEESIEEIEVSD